MSKFQDLDHYVTRRDYLLLPFSFTPRAGSGYIVTNAAGESSVLSSVFLEALVGHEADTSSSEFGEARSAQLAYFPGETAPIELLALKLRTRWQRVAEFTTLHMMVVTLRCDHGCQYCQVSRQSEDRAAYDMTEEVAERSLDLIFSAPSRSIKIEFQGGEPLLNFELIRFVVGLALPRAAAEGRTVHFVIATTMSLLTDEMLDFCEEYGVLLSTSLDGPEELHNRNRPRPGRDSYARFVDGLSRARAKLGRDRVSALMTTTKASLAQPEAIVDEYLALGFDSIFLRPLSPYGFAMRTKAYDAYAVDEWLTFYKRGLAYILELNRSGLKISEIYTTIILRKMFTHNDPGYVDLMNLAGIGIAGVVYNYDGGVYASDEGRMLAEMGIQRFRLGGVLTHSYEEIFGSEELLSALDESFTGSDPICRDCAFEPYCGADPVYHFGVHADVGARKSQSAFCQRQLGIFHHLLELREDPAVENLFRQWALHGC